MCPPKEAHDDDVNQKTAAAHARKAARRAHRDHAQTCTTTTHLNNVTDSAAPVATNTTSSSCCHHVSSRATDTNARCADRVLRQHHARLPAQQLHRHKPQQGLTGAVPDDCWREGVAVEEREPDDEAATAGAEVDGPEDGGGVARIPLKRRLWLVVSPSLNSGRAAYKLVMTGMSSSATRR